MDGVLTWGIIAIVVSSAVLASHYTVAAIRVEHLLLLRSRAYGIWLFERRPDGVYEHISLAGVPAAVARFAALPAAGRLIPARQQIRQRNARLRAMPAATAP